MGNLSVAEERSKEYAQPDTFDFSILRFTEASWSKVPSLGISFINLNNSS
jgi:hypothetical protein